MPTKTLKEELVEYKDKYLRALAELDNYKKRTKKEREEFVNYANESLLLKLIPVLDDFERGIENCKRGATSRCDIKLQPQRTQRSNCRGRREATAEDAEMQHEAKNKEMFENLYRGIELIYKNFKDTLEKEGLKSFSSIGEPFDPRRHEAVSVIKSSQHPPDTVVDELSSGYMLRDKIIRPARVIVSQNVFTAKTRSSQREDRK